MIQPQGRISSSMSFSTLPSGLAPQHQQRDRSHLSRYVDQKLFFARVCPSCPSAHRTPGLYPPPSTQTS